MAAQASEAVGDEVGDRREVARAGAAAVSLVPAVGIPGALVVLMSACSVEGLRTLAAAWDGPVLVVGSPEEARELIGAAPTGDEPAASEEPDGPGPALSLDPDRQVVEDGAGGIPLTMLEFRFLQALNVRPGRLCSFEELTQQVWGTPHIGDVAQVHSLVKRLRRKLRALARPVRLQAVRGLGFRLVAPGSLAPVDD